MFPFVRKSRYNALRKDCQAWMQKAVEAEKRHTRLALAIDEIQERINDARGIPTSRLNSVLEDE